MKIIVQSKPQNDSKKQGRIALYKPTKTDVEWLYSNALFLSFDLWDLLIARQIGLTNSLSVGE